MRAALVFSVVLLIAAGCTATWVEHPSPKEPLDKQARLYPAQEYKIQYGDQLDIKFLYNPELNENLPVRPDGRITLQLVGDLMVVDMTPTQLAEALKTRYASRGQETRDHGHRTPVCRAKGLCRWRSGLGPGSCSSSVL